MTGRKSNVTDQSLPNGHEINLGPRPRWRIRYVEIPDRVSPGSDWTANGVDNFLGALDLFHITWPGSPILEPYTEAAASFQRHPGQGRVHDAWLADRSDRLY